MRSSIDQLSVKNVSTIKDVLTQNGVCIYQSFLDQETLKTLQSEFHQILDIKNEGYLVSRSYDKGAAALVELSQVPTEMIISKVFKKSFYQELLHEYWPQQDLVSNHKIFVVKDVPGTKHIAQDLHFDVARTLKFFIYLTDTNEKNAAFKCVPGSHKWVMENRRKKYKDKISYENRHLSRVPEFNDRAVSMNGKAGDLIIFDTDTLHCAGQCSEGERWVMRGQSEDYVWNFKRSLIDKIFGENKISFMGIVI
jgi:ectoine hydroxylase-related dioxygenase (phytanoyl-CoA dioxygenase family)